MSLYDDSRYYTIQHLHMGTGHADQTSVIGARVELDRKTMMAAVTIKDWNIQVIQGHTATSTDVTTELWNIALSKSAAGTGTVTPMGSASIGTQVDGSVLDGSLTETNLAAGDDLVLSYEQSTALPAGVLKVDADISFVEKFSGG